MEPPATLPSIVRHITQRQLIRYARASGDANPLHLDPDFAATTPYGRPIAHGMLVLAYLAEMLTVGLGEAWLTSGRLRVRFRAPVFPGDTVTTVGSSRPPREPEVTTYTVACRNQAGVEVIAGEASIGRRLHGGNNPT